MIYDEQLEFRLDTEEVHLLLEALGALMLDFPEATDILPLYDKLSKVYLA